MNTPSFLFLARRFVWRVLYRDAAKTLLTILGLALGVAVFGGIQLLNRAAIDQFEAGVAKVSQGINWQLVSATGNQFPLSQLARLRPHLEAGRDQGISFQPVLTQRVLYENQPLHLVGIDLFQQPVRAEEAKNTDADPFRLFQPGSLLAGRFFESGTGERVLLAGDRQIRVSLAGLLPAQAPWNEAYGGRVLVGDISVVQALIHQPDAISRLDLRVPEHATGWVKTLQQTLPGDLLLQRPEQTAGQYAAMVSSYQQNLTALGVIALLVAMFLIYNTMSISVLRRRPELGTLRLLGVSRRQIFGLFLLEALILGLLGSLLGTALGAVLASSLQGLVTKTTTVLYGNPFTAEGIALNGPLLLLITLAGVLFTGIAAIGPIFEATRITPAQVARRASFERRLVRGALPMAGLGLILLLIALGLAFVPAVGSLPVGGYASSFVLVLGMALLIPWLTHALLGLLRGPILKKLSPSLGLALAQLDGYLGRTAFAIASLMVGIALMVAMSVMIGSFRQTVRDWVQTTLRADVVIEAASRPVTFQAVPIQPSVIDTVSASPLVAVTDAFIETRIQPGPEARPFMLGAGDFTVLGSRGNLRFLSGESTRTVAGRVLANPRGAIATEAYATRHHKQVGDTVTIPTPSGELILELEGIYRDYASDLGYVVMSRDRYREAFTDDSVSTLAVYLKPGVTPARFKQAIKQQLDGSAALAIRSTAELRREVLRVFEQTFAITYALHGLAMVIALLGVLTTLLTLAIEQQADLALMRCMGVGTRQLVAQFLTMATALTCLGFGFGLVTGLGLSVLLTEVINRQSFGWQVDWQLNNGELATAFALVLVSGLLAVIWPTRQVLASLSMASLRQEGNR